MGHGDEMKVALRMIWYTARVALVVLSAFAILAVVFFVAMDSANVYIIVTDGMKAKADRVLLQETDTDLNKYFGQTYLDSITADLVPVESDEYTITNIDYNIGVESLWCQPWKNTATVTVVESVPEIDYDVSADLTEEEMDAMEPPTWPRARYTVNLKKNDDAWHIVGVKKVETLPPEATPTPEPSEFITASPVPTATPTATVTATPSATKKD